MAQWTLGPVDHLDVFNHLEHTIHAQNRVDVAAVLVRIVRVSGHDHVAERLRNHFQVIERQIGAFQRRDHILEQHLRRTRIPAPVTVAVCAAVTLPVSICLFQHISRYHVPGMCIEFRSIRTDVVGAHGTTMFVLLKFGQRFAMVLPGMKPRQQLIQHRAADFSIPIPVRRSLAAPPVEGLAACALADTSNTLHDLGVQRNRRAVGLTIE